MNELIEWLKGIDYTTIYVMLGGFVATYGGSIVVLDIGLLKQRIKNFNFQQALEEANAKTEQKQIEKFEALRNDIVDMFSEVQKNIIANNNLANEERMAVINTIVEEANQSVEELKQLTSDESLKGLN